MPDLQLEEQLAAQRDSCVLCRIEDRRSEVETIAHVVNRRAVEHAGDIAVLLARIPLPENWLTELIRAARTESTAATVAAMPGGGGEGDGATVAESRTPRVVYLEPPSGDIPLAPRAAIVTGPCVLVTRAAFNLLGGLDETMSSSAAAIAAFGLRAQQHGLANLLASSLLYVGEQAWLDADDRRELGERFPVSWPAAQDPWSAAAERRSTAARVALCTPSVTIDARALDNSASGTQLYVRELLRALLETSELRVRALVGSDPGQRDAVEGLGEIETITYQSALDGVTPTDLVHRPQQVFTVDDLNLLRPLGRRLVISHLDLIAYHDPTYFSELSHWRRHVRATRVALDLADHVVFFSEYALNDAWREDLIDRERASIVPAGVGLPRVASAAKTQPSAMKGRTGPFLLCLGADYSHKNRPFALELAAQLKRVHGWRGTLVLAGPHMPYGSSEEEERLVLEQHPELANTVVDLGPVSADERNWLMGNVQALIYPTVLEGFGLVPFEAAEAGLPCLFAATSSLAEIFPSEHATLEQWDVVGSADRAWRLLEDEESRRRHVRALRAVAGQFTWKRCAEGTIDAYARALASRARESARRDWESIEREREIVRLDRAVQELRGRLREVADELEAVRDALGPDAIGLVGPDGLLPRPEQRALLALATRRRLREPAFGVLRAGYRLLHALDRDG